MTRDPENVEKFLQFDIFTDPDFKPDEGKPHFIN